MDTQELVNYLDELLYDSTGKHIDSLQVAILKGVLNGEKYKDIADKYKCSASHAKDEAYKLWRLLSQTFNEDINKSNLKATVDRIVAKIIPIFWLIAIKLIRLIFVLILILK